MPTLPPRLCPRHGAFSGAACGGCKRQRARDDNRPSAAAQGYGRRWQKYRMAFLAEHPLCVNPFKRHRDYVPATVVDHIKPHKGDMELFWDPANHQALCLSCNSAKGDR